MGSCVGFSSAGRPCSIPVNARPFAAYEPLLKSGSVRITLHIRPSRIISAAEWAVLGVLERHWLILADNPGGFQGAAAGKAGASPSSY